MQITLISGREDDVFARWRSDVLPRTDEYIATGEGDTYRVWRVDSVTYVRPDEPALHDLIILKGTVMVPNREDVEDIIEDARKEKKPKKVKAT